jgi:hypothetical protein
MSIKLTNAEKKNYCCIELILEQFNRVKIEEQKLTTMFINNFFLKK